MASFWKRFEIHFSSVWKGTFTQTIKSLIQNTVKSIKETSNVFIKTLNVFWLIILIIFLSIALFFKNIFKFIKRLFIVSLEEINFYVALIAKASKNLNNQWGEIVKLLFDIKEYLLQKLDDDEKKSFSKHFNGNLYKLIFWIFLL